MSNDERPMTNDEGRQAISSFVLRPSSFIALVILAFLILGALYAIKTPAWQVPDEPAHYNYVRFIAEGRGLPVLRPGDYDPAYLERIKAVKFPPSMPIGSIRYESWQPPLYYILAAPIYLATNGSLLALRLFSVALGGFVVLLAFLIVRQLAPHSPALALGAAAFVAFVPQHVAMMAGAQNDSLAELILAAIVQVTSRRSQVANGEWIKIGVLLGLGLWTKGTVYIAAPLVLAALWLAYRSPPAPRKWSWGIKRGFLVFVPALVIAVPLWIRNIIVYGWPDFLGAIRHDAVVLGQPTPAEWIAKFGLGEYLRQYVVTTFHSFWGQFGWMGVPMNSRYYAVLAVASLAAFVGFVWWLAGRASQVAHLQSAPQPPTSGLRPPTSNLQPPTRDFWLLTCWILFTVMIYIGYNSKYVQFQGRYLFPALIPIGLAFTMGLRQWTILLPRAWRDAALAVPFVGLAALDVIALFRMIVPMLSP